VIDALEAILESRASEHQLSLSISVGDQSRSASSMSHTEIMDALGRYRGIRREELRKERIARGLDHEDNIYTRFTG
jgi:hypothetical protein